MQTATANSTKTATASPTTRGNQPTWQARYGRQARDVLRALTPTTNGNFVAAGYTEPSTDAPRDAWLLEVDSSGNRVRDKTVGGAGDDVLMATTNANSGGLAAAGRSGSRGRKGGWVLGLDDRGSVNWQTHVGSQGSRAKFDFFRTIGRAHSEGYIAGGSTKRGGRVQGWLARLQPDGSVMWQQAYRQLSIVNDIVRAPNGDYIVAGERSGTDTGGRLMRVTRRGRHRWSRAYGTSTTKLRSVVRGIDGGWVGSGSTGGGETPGQAFVVQTADNGTARETRRFGRQSVDEVFAATLRRGRAGYLHVGWQTTGRGTKNLIAFTDTNARQRWRRSFGRASYSALYSLVPATEGTYMAGGAIGTRADGWLLRRSM